MKHRLIGILFPLKEIGEIASKDKYIASGHLQTFHPWWARRPLPASRSTIFASLVDPPQDIEEWATIGDFMVDLSKWKNANNFNLIDQAKKQILQTHGEPPKIIDPFGGGGSIPLEGLRLGCHVFSNDYNPVSVLIQKCMIEFPQKYLKHEKNDGIKNQQKNELVQDLKYWADWIFNESIDEIGKFYSKENIQNLVGCIWAKTIQCRKSSCRAEIPLIKQFILSEKQNISLIPKPQSKKLSFRISNGGEQINSKTKGTIGSRSITDCLICGERMKGDYIRNEFKNKNNGQRLLVKITSNENTSGKKYEITTKTDEKLFEQAEIFLENKIKILSQEWQFNPIPDEPTPLGNGKGAERAFGIQNYGYMQWGQLFNARQQLALITFIEKARLAYDEMLKQKYDKEHAKIVFTYLGLMISRLANRMSMFTYWSISGEKIQSTFVRPALSTSWDYIELNPFSDFTGGWKKNVDDVVKVVEHVSTIENQPGTVTHSTASNLPYDDNYFDAVITDPPYYDNIPYSYLSDFFYVWLKRCLGNIYPELFSTPLTPKSEEAVVYGNREGGFDAGKSFFESEMKKSFKESYRILKNDGISVIVYAHKSTEGWETLINSILDSGLVITAAWPIHTEMQTRLRSRESAALASSIYMIARKWEKIQLGFYRDIKKNLEKHIAKKLENLWTHGISGADFFLAAIGSSLEIFGKYEKIIDDNDQPISVRKMLEDVRKIVTDFAIHQILQNGFGGEISQMTRFYILCRWAYGESKVSFDEALKMAQSTGIDIENELNTSFIHKDGKEAIRILGPSDRKFEDINSKEMIDVLHKAVLLWKKNERDSMIKIIKESGYGDNDVFYKVAQAISDSNPGSSESKLLDGFLTGKSKIMNEMSSEKSQTKLL